MGKHSKREDLPEIQMNAPDENGVVLNVASGNFPNGLIQAGFISGGVHIHDEDEEED